MFDNLPDNMRNGMNGNWFEALQIEGITKNDGGTVFVTASDDGSSAMSGRMFGASDTTDSSLPTLKISGGTLYVNADGDGLDSNGDLIVEGGNIIVDGPTNSGNGALDSGSENGGSIVCNGGTILAIGASGMAESFESNSTQCSFSDILPPLNATHLKWGLLAR